MFYQINFFNFLYRNKNVLKKYVENFRAIIEQKFEKKIKQRRVFANLLNHDFWNVFDDTKQILNFLFEIQKMFEINNTHFDHVMSRWRKIEIYFRNFSNKFNFVSTINLKILFEFRIDKHDNSKKNIWQTRFDIQILNIHWIAYYLNFVNYEIDMSTDIQTRIFNFLKRYIENADFIIAIDQFFAFRIRQNIAKFFFSIFC